MRILLLSVILVLLVKNEYMDRKLESLIIDRNEAIKINKSHTETFKLLEDQKEENNDLLLQREQRRLKQDEDSVVTTETLNNLLYEKEKYHNNWPDDVIDWLQQPY
ncbi:hypothetical protein [Photobacterium andalusiense]|uniref:Phage lysis regulatory protein, LysB family n=1 Tax=Photobacterium andalusiense TaxID=2204296 RepID=A0A1Y6MHE4_9GAMM|nr:hypothetical protein [Photobacterium andalusiense]SMY35200.1 hypothetical protein PAND9192_01868 [Photobacterium andalusiense]